MLKEEHNSQDSRGSHPESLSRALFTERCYGAIGRESLTPWSEMMAELRRASRDGFTPAQAEAYDALANVTSFMRMSSGPSGSLDPLVSECIGRAKAHLEAQGVEIVPIISNFSECLRISTQGNHLLNRIARGLHRWHDGLELYYDPRGLQNGRALALYHIDLNRITLPHDFILNVHRIKDDFVNGFGHEAQHSLTARDLRRGKPSPYYGMMTSRVGLPIDAGGYERYLHFDELKTHSFDARALERKLIGSGPEDPRGLSVLRSSMLMGICERGWRLGFEIRSACDLLLDRRSCISDPEAWTFTERKEAVTKKPIVYGNTFLLMKDRRVDIEIPLVSSPGLSPVARWPLNWLGSDRSEKRSKNLELMAGQLGMLRAAADRHRAELSSITRRHVLTERYSNRRK